jgi:DNA-binding transcriptional LysR family regulator
LPDLSLDLRYLRYVFAVVEQGSFRQAASKLDVPHGVDASRVDSWEIDLGTAINF